MNFAKQNLTEVQPSIQSVLKLKIALLVGNLEVGNLEGIPIKYKISQNHGQTFKKNTLGTILGRLHSRGGHKTDLPSSLFIFQAFCIKPSEHFETLQHLGESNTPQNDFEQGVDPSTRLNFIYIAKKY